MRREIIIIGIIVLYLILLKVFMPNHQIKPQTHRYGLIQEALAFNIEGEKSFIENESDNSYTITAFAVDDQGERYPVWELKLYGGQKVMINLSNIPFFSVEDPAGVTDYFAPEILEKF